MSNKDRCDNCAHFAKDYKLSRLRVPSTCNRFIMPVDGDDPACVGHELKEDGHG